jgi:5-methylcytosine-specific restriction enzyme A
MAAWPYSTANWQRLRKLKLQTNPLCEPCRRLDRLVPAVAVDHILAINDGGDAFPALDGLMSMCTRCHNRKTRIVEQQGKELTTKGCDVHGMPLDPTHPWYQERRNRGR